MQRYAPARVCLELFTPWLSQRAMFPNIAVTLFVPAGRSDPTKELATTSNEEAIYLDGLTRTFFSRTS